MIKDRFETLRTYLSEDPSEETWTQILSLFEDWESSAELDVAFDYANEHLESWPSHLRKSPKHWNLVLLGAPKKQVNRSWRRGERAHPAFLITRWVKLPSLHTFQSRDLRHLHKAKSLKNVETLILDWLSIGGEGINMLISCPTIPSLRQLVLNGNRLEPDDIEAFANSPFLSRLETLHIENNDLKIEGLRSLVQSAHVTQLTYLGLENVRLNEEGFQLIAQSPQLAQLSTLHLSRNSSLSLKACEALAEALFLPTLHTLHLYGTGIQNMEHFASIPFPSLRALDLGYTSLNAEDARLLTKSESMQHIEALHCRDIDEEALNILQAHFGEKVHTKYNKMPWRG